MAKERIREVEIPVETKVENITFVEKVIEKEVPIDVIIEKKVEYVVEKVIEVPVEKIINIPIEIKVEVPKVKEKIIEEEILIETEVFEFN